MPDKTGLLGQWYITIDGQLMSEEFRHAVFSATVESSLHLPDVATLHLHDPGGTWVDSATLAPGKSLQISAKAENVEHKLFDGEIVELESDFVIGDRRVVVRAFDRLHRLARIRHARTFVNATDSDIVSKCAGEANLSPRTGSVSIVHDYVLQDGLSNLEFLQERAALVGYMLWVDGKELHFDEHGKQSGSVVLEFGVNLAEFHPRLTSIDQVNSVSVNGWDPKEAKAVTGKVSSGNGAPKLDHALKGGALAKEAFSIDADVLVLDKSVRNQDVAQKIAQGVMDRREGRLVEADGLTHGTPTLLAGSEVEIKGVGNRFKGKYFVTGATHEYGGPQGYVTHFTVSGYQPSTLLSLLGGGQPHANGQRSGLVVGIVTDINDPEHLGRVKVKYPWMNDQLSDWARVAMPGAGPTTGVEFMPEVNDEVLIGFEHGNRDAPFVLGSMWNGKTKAPVDFNKLIGNGKVLQRVIRSRTGHSVTLDDSDDKPFIEIVDNTGKNKITLDSKKNKLTVHLEGDMLFEATSGEIQIKAQKVTVEASDALKMKGNTVDAEAQSNFDIKATSALKLKGMTSEFNADTSLKVSGGTQTEVKGGAQLTLDGGAMTQVKGGMVQVG